MKKKIPVRIRKCPRTIEKLTGGPWSGNSLSLVCHGNEGTSTAWFRVCSINRKLKEEIKWHGRYLNGVWQDFPGVAKQ